MISKERFNGIIAEYIGTTGTFVEVGAFDGETLSNTAHLADNGWKGYYFEPIIEFANQCYRRHRNNNAEIFAVGIGKPGIRKMFVSGMLTTLRDENYQKKISGLPWFKGTEFKVKEVLICSPHVLPICDLLVIDVEGTEYEILSQLHIRPKVIMVELHEDSPEWGQIINSKQSIELLEKIGYTKIYHDDVDSIFVL